MTCRFCEKVWDYSWAQSDAWERTTSNDAQLLSEESDESWDLIQRAGEIADDDPAAAFPLFLAAADCGSVWSMERVAWHYWTGSGVAADSHAAVEYYQRAIGRGSLMATISYARLLAWLGQHEDCERTLEESVASGFLPAYFWLGWSRYQHAKTREACRKARPLIEHAAENGHPAAKLFLARWMALGRLGLHNIPRGWVALIRLAASSALAAYRAAPA